MALIVTKGSALFDSEVKSNVERLFQDIVDRLKAQDNDDNAMPDTDGTDDAV